MNLVIDWGNTTLKTGWFDGSTLTHAGRYDSSEALIADVRNRLSGGYQPRSVLVSSTSRPAGEMRHQLRSLSRDVVVLDAQTPVPIRKAYGTPATLGTDRVAAAVGAVTQFPGRDCLVLDLGTCLTADFVDRDAVFQGGLISPGLHMRLRAMHEQTARLPLVELPRGGPGADGQSLPWPDLTTKSTQQAILSGVLNGLAFELNGLIDAYQRAWPNVVVVLCGGDAATFESRLKPPIFVVPELVLIGLNRILRDHVENLRADTPDVNA